MNDQISWRLRLSAVALVFATVVVAQTPTLPEQVAAAQSDVTLTSGGDGPILLFEYVLAQTDFVVRARIGSLISYLSEDRRSIYTTYQLINPAVLYAAKVVPSATPGVAPPQLSLEQRGGTVAIGRFQATEQYEEGAKLTSGMDVLLLLQEVRGQGKYRAAAGYGVFEVRESKIVPLVPGNGPHQAFAGMDADGFITDVVARRRRLSVK